MGEMEMNRAKNLILKTLPSGEVLHVEQENRLMATVDRLGDPAWRPMTEYVYVTATMRIPRAEWCADTVQKAKEKQ